MPSVTDGGPSPALWSLLEQVLRDWAVPGAAIAVVHGGDRVEARGFGVRDLRHPDGPVTPESLFHVASLSKTVVATTALRLVARGDLDLAGRLTAYLPDLPWTDPRTADITLTQVLSHTAGIGDSSDYAWHRPQRDDGALGRWAAEVAGWPLVQEPGHGFRYSNAGYALLGHLLSRVAGQPFETVVAEQVLQPLGMEHSAFEPPDGPGPLVTAPHVGLPPRVLDGAYPYTRQHAPNSSLHTSAAELGRWMTTHLTGGGALLPEELHAALWAPRAAVEDSAELDQAIGLGWFLGEHRGHATVGHPGSDPGFQCNLTLVPGLGIGVAVLVNCNTAPVFGLTRLVLDVLLGEEPVVPLPPVTVGLGEVLAESGVEAAVAHYEAAAAAEPVTVDLDSEGFVEAVWGAVELHRGDVVEDVLAVWRRVQPESAAEWSEENEGS